MMYETARGALYLIAHLVGPQRTTAEAIRTMGEAFSSSVKAALGPTRREMFEESIRNLGEVDRVRLLREWDRAHEN